MNPLFLLQNIPYFLMWSFLSQPDLLYPVRFRRLLHPLNFRATLKDSDTCKQLNLSLSPACYSCAGSRLAPEPLGLRTAPSASLLRGNQAWRESCAADGGLAARNRWMETQRKDCRVINNAQIFHLTGTEDGREHERGETGVKWGVKRECKRPRRREADLCRQRRDTQAGRLFNAGLEWELIICMRITAWIVISSRAITCQTDGEPNGPGAARARRNGRQRTTHSHSKRGVQRGSSTVKHALCLNQHTKPEAF